MRRFAEAVGILAKTDPVSAGPIARMGALLEPAPDAPKPEVLADLRELQLARAALLKDRTAIQNQGERIPLALLS